LTSMDPIYVTFQVDERQLVSHLLDNSAAADNPEQAPIENKDRFKLSLTLPNGQEYNQPGTFRFADTRVDEGTGTLTLRASFPNPHGVILPGLYVTLQAESNTLKLSPMVPQAAVQQNQSGHFVLVVTAENTVATRQIELGRRMGAMWVVNKGLKAGELIIVQGLQKVRPGAKVSPNMVTVNPTTGTITPNQKQGN
nr:efflux RND transporter periplasmic adaptor subunit [Endozoicomonas sp.]